ncbi:MAG: winged helix-turn-helix transcriptional regulator, partial [Candidatus Omnitrophica bacterium]|nr:winged helix-turn-helix transcriptional regulator [Candidatus Omnitrophota bacterium]
EGRDLPPDWSGLKRACSSFAPRSSAAAQRLLTAAEGARPEEVVDQLWDLPALIHQETGLPCLLVLDEFHRLKDLPGADPFQRLGRKIMVQSGTQYLVISSQPAVAGSILREGLNLLFGQFDLVEMRPLGPAACLKAIRSHWPEGRGNLFAEQILAELTQGYAGYLDLLLHGLVVRGPLTTAERQERGILDLLEALLLDSQGELRRRFEARVRSLPPHPGRRGWIQILIAVAEGSHRVPQIARRLDRSRSQVIRAMQVLEQAGLLAKEGAFYRMPDRLLRLWVLTAYPILQWPGQADPVQARVHFRDAAWAWMAKVREAIRLPVEEQVVALLKQWGGEQVEIEGRRLLLPRFRRVELTDGPGGRPSVVSHRAGTSGATWMVLPWTGPLDEGEARSLARQVAEWPFKYHQKVLLGAYPVEMNARLILREAKIRLWDLETLNALLDLYGLDCRPLPGRVSTGTEAPVEPLRSPILNPQSFSPQSSIHEVAG